MQPSVPGETSHETSYDDRGDNGARVRSSAEQLMSLPAQQLFITDTSPASVGNPAERSSPQRLQINSLAPGLLHLTPCTLDEYSRLEYDPRDRYELVQGILVWCPLMGDTEHSLLISHLIALINLLPQSHDPPVNAYTTCPLLLHTEESNTGHRREQASLGSHSPSSLSKDSSENEAGATSRYPDIVIVDKTTESSGSENTRSPSKGCRLPRMREAAMVVEVTSLNRADDLRRKKVEYEEKGIPEYMIINREKQGSIAKRCVIVHTLDRRGKYKSMTYRGSTKVACSFFSHFNLSAEQMLDHKALERIAADKKGEMAKQLDIQRKKNKELGEVVETKNKELDIQKKKNRDQAKDLERLRAKMRRMKEERSSNGAGSSPPLKLSRHSSDQSSRSSGRGRGRK